VSQSPSLSALAGIGFGVGLVGYKTEGQEEYEADAFCADLLIAWKATHLAH